MQGATGVSTMRNRPRIRLTKDQLRWHLSEKEKELLIQSMVKILKSKESSLRERAMAAKNLLLCNAQDIDLAKHEEPAPESMTIRIEEVDFTNKKEDDEEAKEATDE